MLRTRESHCDVPSWIDVRGGGIRSKYGPASDSISSLTRSGLWINTMINLNIPTCAGSVKRDGGEWMLYAACGEKALVERLVGQVL